MGEGPQSDDPLLSLILELREDLIGWIDQHRIELGRASCSLESGSQNSPATFRERKKPAQETRRHSGDTTDPDGPQPVKDIGDHRFELPTMQTSRIKPESDRAPSVAGAPNERLDRLHRMLSDRLRKTPDPADSDDHSPT